MLFRSLLLPAWRPAADRFPLPAWRPAADRLLPVRYMLGSLPRCPALLSAAVPPLLTVRYMLGSLVQYFALWMDAVPLPPPVHLTAAIRLLLPAY